MSKIKVFSSIFVALACAAILVLGTFRKNATNPIQTVSGQNNTANTADGSLWNGPRGPIVEIAKQPADSERTIPPVPAQPSRIASKIMPTVQKPKIKPKTTINPATNKSTVKTSANLIETPCQGGFTDSFFCLLNQYRAANGLNTLSQNSGLAGVALSHSQWMNTTGTFSHTGINGSRLTERCANAGITCHGENLAQGAKSAQNLFDMWKASGSHNQNLLGNFSAGGLGISGSYITLLLN